MNKHIKALEERLIGLFERKMVEFKKYSEENPSSAPVTSQLAFLYAELVDAIKH